MRFKKYLKNKNEFVQYKNKLKLISCPFCKTISTLVLYGPLKNRGHRCLCSNRFNKKGCGKTFSFIWGNIIKNHTVKPNDLWEFLKKYLLKKNIDKAIKLSKINFSRRSVNHWIKKLKDVQSILRYYLSKIIHPPTIKSKIPFLQTIKHLKICFNKKDCPIISYQCHFQRSIFEK